MFPFMSILSIMERFRMFMNVKNIFVKKTRAGNSIWEPNNIKINGNIGTR